MEWLLTGRGPATVAEASGLLNSELGKLAKLLGGTTDEQQANFERLLELKTPLIEEVNALRERVHELESILDEVGKLVRRSATRQASKARQSIKSD